MTDDAFRENEIVEEDDRELEERSGDKFEFDAKHHAYFLNGREMTGCTTILGVIAKPALIQWAANEAVAYVKSMLDEEGVFRPDVDWRDALATARTAHTRKRDDAAQKGTDKHAIVEQWIKGCIETNGGHPNIAVCPLEILDFCNWSHREDIRFLASEQQVYSRSLFVAGTFDFMFEKDGKRYVGDLKCRKKIYSREPMLQCAGYAIMAEEMGQRPFDGYCIVRMLNGEFEVLWSYDIEGDKEGFLAAARLYRLMQNWAPVK